MVPRSERRARGWSLTQRLSVALSIGAVFVAVLLGFVGADREDRHLENARAVAEQALAVSLGERAAPLLDRGDVMRLSVLAAVVRDQAQGRALVLDRTGRVLLDTSLVHGEKQLSLLAASGPFQRTSLRQDGVSVRESLAPVRFGGDVIGEVRLQRSVEPIVSAFDFTWFGLVLLASLSLVAVAAIIGHHWSTRVRGATSALIRLAAGEMGGASEDAAEGELQELGNALREMERGVQDGLQCVAEGYIAMALQVVDGLERRRLVPPGHGERTARLAAKLADRLQLLPADKKELDLACHLVDLGKAWVRPSILQKQGPLTEVETQSLQHHPVRAAEQLDSMPALRRIAKIVRHQLERYDGTGAPDALRGERIPLGSRILAIASAFDLLTTCAEDRPLAWQDALAQLTKARGEVFDAWLVDLFAAEVQKDPPTLASDREVMIVPGGVLPWRAPDADADDEHDDDAPELEVMHDDSLREELP